MPINESKKSKGQTSVSNKLPSRAYQKDKKERLNHKFVAYTRLGGFLWFFFVFYAIPMVLVLYVGFWLLEYFDEDIYTIISVRQKIKAKNYYA